MTALPASWDARMQNLHIAASFLRGRVVYGSWLLRGVDARTVDRVCTALYVRQVRARVPSEFVVVANVAGPDASFRFGTRVVVVHADRAEEEIEVHGSSRSGAMITKHVSRTRLGVFRVARQPLQREAPSYGRRFGLREDAERFARESGMVA